MKIYTAIMPFSQKSTVPMLNVLEIGKWGNGEMGRAMRVVVDWIGSLTNG